MKRGLLQAVAVVLSAVLWVGAARAELIVSLNPGAQTVLVGESFEVELRIAGLETAVVPSLSSFVFFLDFDPSLLMFTGVTYGDLLRVDANGSYRTGEYDGLEYFSDYDTVQVAETSYADEATLAAAQPSDFWLARIGFTVLAEGVSTLALDLGMSSMTDGNWDYLAFAGGVTMAEVTGAVPEPGTLLLLALGVGLLGARRRDFSRA